jgi:hypothetical protein
MVLSCLAKRCLIPAAAARAGSLNERGAHKVASIVSLWQRRIRFPKQSRMKSSRLGNATLFNRRLAEPITSIRPACLIARERLNPAGWTHSGARSDKSRATLVPCLRKALNEERSDSFFNIDGSMLLVEVDPSRASKALQVRNFVKANLDGTDLEYWVKTMAASRRGRL